MRSKQDQTKNKAKQHSTPKAVTFHVHVCVTLCVIERLCVSTGECVCEESR